MKLMIIGAGGYGHTVADIAKQSGRYESIGFLDDNEGLDYTLGKCGDYKRFADKGTEIYPAFGNNVGRLQWIEKLVSEGISVPTLIHSTAYVSPEASIGVGTMVLPKSVVNTECVVEMGCIINCGAVIDHGCVIEKGCHVCIGALVKGENRIKSCTKIEAGEVINAREYPV